MLSGHLLLHFQHCCKVCTCDRSYAHARVSGTHSCIKATAVALVYQTLAVVYTWRPVRSEMPARLTKLAMVLHAYWMDPISCSRSWSRNAS